MVARPVGEASPWTRHDCDILFNFVLAGEMTLEGEGKDLEVYAGSDGVERAQKALEEAAKKKSPKIFVRQNQIKL